MSRRRPAPGRRIGAGTLRVDAARAVMKLRDYQLPEPEMWILELLRAGVALGAEAVRVDGDADDIRVAWDGPAPDIDDLTTLLDELVNPVSDPARRYLRLMATAINTALGLSPRYVDIIVNGTERVRFTPSILEVDEGDPLSGASKLRDLTAEPIARPRGAPERGVLVHLRRFPDLGVLNTFVSGREPPELRLVRESCDDPRVPIRIGGGVLTRERSDRDLLRVPLGPGLDGFLALTRASALPDWARPAIFEACEQGVLLARHPIELGFTVHGPVPIRLSIDADRLPTNASRSEVRRAEAPIAQAEERVHKVFEELVKRLARELGPDAEGDWSELGSSDLHRSAFALLASALAVGDFRERARRESLGPLEPLSHLPLLRDAFGRPKTLRQLGARGGNGAFVYRGDEALPEKYEEWLSDLVWIPPGDPAELLLAGAEVEDVKPRIVGAERSRLARRRYLRYPVHDGRVPQAEGQLLAMSLADIEARVDATYCALESAFFAGAHLGGELCLTSPERGAWVSYLYDGRLLARRQIESPISFTAVVSSGLLAPNADFSGILDDEGAATVDRALVAAAIWAGEALARRLLDERGETGELRGGWFGSRRKLAKIPAVHAVLRMAIGAHAELFDKVLVGPLAQAPAWYAATPDGERRWVSLAEVLESAEAASWTLFQTSRDAVLRANPGLPEGRLVVSGTHWDLETLNAQFPDMQVVRYSRAALAKAHDEASLGQELASLTGAALTFEKRAGCGAIGFTTGESSVEIRHLGVSLERHRLQELETECRVLYESPHLIPGPDHAGVAHGSVPKHFVKEERALLRSVARHMLGDDVPGFHWAGETFEQQIVPAFLERLGRVELKKALGTVLQKRLMALPLFRVVGSEEGPVSLGELAAFHPGPLHWVPLEYAVGFDAGAFRPLRAPERLATAVAAILGKSPKNAIRELERRERKAVRRARLEAHRELDPIPEVPLGDHSREVDVPSGPPTLPRIRLELPREVVVGTLRVLIDDRRFCDVQLPDGPPIHGLARLRARAADATLEGLTPRARERLVELATSGVPALLAKVAKAAPEMLRSDIPARRLLDWWLENNPGSVAEDLGEDLETLGRAQIFDTVQGDKVGALDALRRTQVYVASYVGMWIGPDEGEAPHSLDRPILRVSEGEAGERQLALITGLTGRKISSVTRACEQLQARRRVASGLVPKPTLHGHHGVSHVHDVSALVGNNRALRAALGPGEIGLDEGDTSRVFVQRGGQQVGVVVVDVSPPVRVTLESPAIGRDLTKVKKLSKLANRVQELADRLIRRLVSAGGHGLLSSVEKRRIRSAILAGAIFADGTGDELPLYESTTGLWFTKQKLRDQYEDFTDVWYVPDLACDAVALEETRHVFRMSHEDATFLLGDVMLLIDATDELRLDAEARRNRQRRPLESLKLGYGEERAAIAYETLKGKGELAIEGIVAPLRPGLNAHRGLRLSRARHPLGEHRDPCGWPTRAVLDSPGLEPNRTWSGANEEHPSYEEICRAVRRASDKALRKMIPIPKDALEPRRVGSAECRRVGARVPVRGALWASRAAGHVRVTDRDGIRELRAPDGRGSLPLGGVLYVDGRSDMAAAEDVALVVYARIVVSLARRLTNAWDPLMAAHVVEGLALGAVKANDLPPDETWPLGAARAIGPATIARWLSGTMGIVWVVTPEGLEDAKRTFEVGTGGPTEENPWLINDGSVAAKMILHHLAWRARRWPPEASPNVLASPRVGGLEATEGAVAEAAETEIAEKIAGLLSDLVTAKAEAPLAPPPPPDVAHYVTDSLAATTVGVTVQVVPSRRRTILRRHGAFYQLAGHNPSVAAVQKAIDGGDPRRGAAVALLTARVVGEANRVHDDVTDEHELDALVTLLGTRMRR